MPSSMTGFGRGRVSVQGRDITVEIRSVNHRYLEVRSALPPELGFSISELDRKVKERLVRGRLDLHVTLGRAPSSTVRPQVDVELAQAYREVFDSMVRSLDLNVQVDVRWLLEAPGVVQTPEPTISGTALREALSSALEEALDELEGMRRTEGEHLASAVLQHLAQVRRFTGMIRQEAPRASEQRKQKLQERLRDLTDGAGVDPSRLAQEVALMADRVDIVEELERLAAHESHAEALLSSEGPVGRKLDFLVQEMNRETNTIGAKCADAAMAHAVVELKAELERMREQIQNIE